jgi:CheY-like chemotaxis protein
MPDTKKILIVDDDPDILASVSALLEESGYGTDTASNGEQGLEKARASAPDLFILDLLMPEKSGLKLLNELRTDENLKKIPVIILSGASQVTGVDLKHYLSDHELRQKKRKVFGQDMEIDPQAFIEKPFDPVKVIETVQKFI